MALKSGCCGYFRRNNQRLHGWINISTQQQITSTDLIGCLHARKDGLLRAWRWYKITDNVVVFKRNIQHCALYLERMHSFSGRSALKFRKGCTTQTEYPIPINQIRPFCWRERAVRGMSHPIQMGSGLCRLSELLRNQNFLFYGPYLHGLKNHKCWFQRQIKTHPDVQLASKCSA